MTDRSERENAHAAILKTAGFLQMQTLSCEQRKTQGEITIANWWRQFHRIESDGGSHSEEKFRELAVSVGGMLAIFAGAPGDDPSNPSWPPQGAIALTPSTPEGNAAGRSIVMQETAEFVREKTKVETERDAKRSQASAANIGRRTKGDEIQDIVDRLAIGAWNKNGELRGKELWIANEIRGDVEAAVAAMAKRQKAIDPKWKILKGWGPESGDSDESVARAVDRIKHRVKKVPGFG
jgi:hypothetical protein